MNFAKMQINGNDYVIVNCFNEKFENPFETAEYFCSDHFGIGANGLICLFKSDVADFRLRFFCADGTEIENDAHGIACACKYAFENELTINTNIKIETLSGIKNAVLTVFGDNVSIVDVNMGEPVFTPQLIPVDYTGDDFINKVISVNGDEYYVTCLSLGTPFVISFTDKLDDINLSELGLHFETHQIFPRRTSISFVHIIDNNNIEIRTWERGVSETFSSGSGACCALVAANLTKNVCRNVTAHFIGGDEKIEWNENNNCVYITCCPKYVFKGSM